MVDSIRPIADLGLMKSEQARPKAEKISCGADAKLWVKLPSADDPAFKRIELILTMFPGQQQIIIYFERERKRIGAHCLIHEALVAELKEMLGDGSVVVK